MRRPGIYPLLWGLLLLASSGLLWAWSFGLPGGDECDNATCVVLPVLAPALLSAAGLASAVLGLVLLVRRREGIDAAAARPVADQSMTTAVAVLGIALAALGGAVGDWLVWIGAVVFLAGIAGLIRESRAVRALRREVRR
jgi:hypothetical protein